MKRQLLIATHNAGKLAELSAMLGETDLAVVSLRQFSGIVDVEETGVTFRDNAALKAAGYARQAKTMTLADDSGLEVEALGDRPGVFSARYGGADLGYPAKMKKLLDELTATGDRTRKARFVCALAVADEGGNILFECGGICSGQIAPQPRGSGGFGYDPIFIPDGHDDTFGELSESIKREIGHRALAFRQIIPFLRHF